MAKPDWGELQRRFRPIMPQLVYHRRIGVKRRD